MCPWKHLHPQQQQKEEVSFCIVNYPNTSSIILVYITTSQLRFQLLECRQLHFTDFIISVASYKAKQIHPQSQKLYQRC